MPDLVADTDKIDYAGTLLKSMSDDYQETYGSYPQDDGLTGNAPGESNFLAAWRGLKDDLNTLVTRTVENLEEHGIALQAVAGNHQAADEAAAADFEIDVLGGSPDMSSDERQEQFDGAVASEDAAWDNRNAPYSHG